MLAVAAGPGAADGRLGFRCGKDAIARMLREGGYSLQGMAKVLEGRQHPDRDAQFRHINAMIGEFTAAGDPAVSVDGKKKEQLGPYHRDGPAWRPQGDPVQVRDHDFPDEELGKIAPYGVYDIAANTGFVSVGHQLTTPAAFAVNALRLWWAARGQLPLPRRGAAAGHLRCRRLNGYRCRLWKDQLAVLAGETGLKITVVHFPPGTQCRCLCGAKQFMVTLRWCGRWNRHASVGGLVRSCPAGDGGPVGDPGACRGGA